MDFTRRQLLTSSLGSAAMLASPLSAFGLDAAQFGIRPGATDDQTGAMQRAIDQAARGRVPLVLAPGVYRLSHLRLPDGAHLAGVAGQTRLLLTHGPSLLSAEGSRSVTLAGLTLEGAGQALPEGRGLVHIVGSGALRIADCIISGANGNAIMLNECGGDVTGNIISGSADNALFSNDGLGLRITGNLIAKSGNGGIRIWQSVKRHDGSLIADNKIDDTSARAGGSGQNGNAVNVFRAGGVTVRNNQIRRAAFTAIRGNAASQIQITGNNCSALDEVAIYCEFEFENALIADNVVDVAASGISVTNFKEGGRGAIVRGNIIRNVGERRPGAPPQEQGIGIGVEADTMVTGNTVENAEMVGIGVGWGPYLRDVTVTGNTVRGAGIGVAVSVVNGAGRATISGNTIVGAKRGAIVGMEWHKAVTGDLSRSGAERYPQLRIGGNQGG